jgi:hypothetical protein
MNPIVEKTIKQLSKATLSVEDRVALTNALLNKLGAFPVGDMIIKTENSVNINGKDLDLDQYLNFKEACVALKENFARRVINEQLKYKATKMGIHESTTIETLLFAKAVIWFINEEEILIERLSTL